MAQPIMADAISVAPTSLLGDMGFGGDEFSEDDVLPFLLQAQDIIAKFESRVLELEGDLSTINRAYEHDRNEWLTGLSQKDFYIHHLSKKIQRLEFSNKEAIVVLSDIQPLQSSVSDHFANDYETRVGNKINLALDYLKNAQNTAPPNDDIAVIDQEEDEEYEEGELERRQEAASTWQRRKSVVSIADSMMSHKIMMSLVKNRAESLHFHDDITDIDDFDDTALDVDDLEYRESIDESSSSRQTDVDDLQIDTREALSTVTAASSVTNVSPPIHDNQHNDHDHDHYFATRPAPSSMTNGASPAMVMKPPGAAFCSNCRQLLVQLDQQIEQKAYLKRDVSALASNLTEEQEIRNNIERAKELLETDVDELVGAMFDLVNRTIMDDAEASATGSVSNQDVRGDRLRDMKTILVELDSAKRRSTNVSSLNSNVNGNGSNGSVYTGSVNNASIFSFGNAKRFSFGGIAGIPGTPQRLSSSSSVRTSVSGGGSSHPEDLFGTPQRYVYIDGLGFTEFQDHLKAVITHPTNNATTTSAYMKRVLAEDVEPTLFQTGTQNWWKSPWFKRKLIEAISRNCCEIQTHRSSMSAVSSSGSRPGTPTTPTASVSPIPPPKLKCSSCGVLRLCEYRMRITLPDNKSPAGGDANSLAGLAASRQPWLPIDRFCRDRLVAVCEFYTFLSHLKQGLLSHSPVLGLYKQSLYYRRKMGLARVGSMSLFGDDVDKGWDHTGGQAQVGPKRASLVMTNGVPGVNGADPPASLINVGVGANGWETNGTIIIVH